MCAILMGNAFGNKSTAFRGLFRTAAQFPTVELLDDEPQLLANANYLDAAQNANAFAHAMRLASYEYHHAFGRGYRHFPIEAMKLHYFGSQTLAVGKDHRMLGAITIHSHSPTHAELGFLFRHREMGSKGIGKQLLGAALGHCASEGHSRISLQVTVQNSHARELYNVLGFKEMSISKSGDGKLVNMEISAAAAEQTAAEIEAEARLAKDRHFVEHAQAVANEVNSRGVETIAGFTACYGVVGETKYNRGES